MSKSVNFWKPNVLCASPHSKGSGLFRSSFFSDVCDSAWKKAANESSVVPDPGVALGMHGQGCRELAAGSRGRLLSQTQRENHSSHPERSLVLRGTLGRPQEGMWDKESLLWCVFLSDPWPTLSSKDEPSLPWWRHSSRATACWWPWVSHLIPLQLVASSVKRDVTAIWFHHRFAVRIKWADPSKAFGLAPRTHRHSRKGSICCGPCSYLSSPTKGGVHWILIS